MADEGKNDERPLEFEAAIRELERIVELLGDDDVELDEAMRLFEEGVSHLRNANQLLDTARGRIEELIEDSSGDLKTSPLDPGRDNGDVSEDVDAHLS